MYSLFGFNIDEYSFAITGLSPKFSIIQSNNINENTFLLLVPVLITLITLEFSFLFLNKLSVGFVRNSLITFILIIAGYLIILVFYELFKVVLVPQDSILWGKIIKLWHLEGNQIFVFLFFVLIILFSYLQLLQQRLIKFINIEIKPKKKKD